MAAFKVGEWWAGEHLGIHVVVSVDAEGGRTILAQMVGHDTDAEELRYRAELMAASTRLARLLRAASMVLYRHDLRGDLTEEINALLKKLGNEPVNDAPKVTVREGK